LYDPEDREMDPDVVRAPEDLTVGAGAYCLTPPPELRREDVPVLRFLMVEG
jgi:hypothetical protein